MEVSRREFIQKMVALGLTATTASALFSLLSCVGCGAATTTTTTSPTTTTMAGTTTTTTTTPTTTTTTTPPPALTGQIGGVVWCRPPGSEDFLPLTKATSDNPENATVTILGPVSRVTTVNEAGLYIFEDLPAGSYEVTASARWYLSWTQTEELSSGQEVTLEPFLLARGRGIIKGRIVCGGNGIATAKLRAVNVTTAYIAAATYSEADGSYSMEVPAGVYLVLVGGIFNPECSAQAEAYNVTTHRFVVEPDTTVIHDVELSLSTPTPPTPELETLTYQGQFTMTVTTGDWVYVGFNEERASVTTSFPFQLTLEQSYSGGPLRGEVEVDVAWEGEWAARSASAISKCPSSSGSLSGKAVVTLRGEFDPGKPEQVRITVDELDFAVGTESLQGFSSECEPWITGSDNLLFAAFFDSNEKKSSNFFKASGDSLSFGSGGDQLGFLARQYLTRKGQYSGTAQLTLISGPG